MRGIKIRKSNVKSRILEKTGGLCAVCGRPLEYEKVTIEHVIPKYHGGTDDERNLLPLCKNCNKQKGSRLVPVEQYYPHVKEIFLTQVSIYRSEWEQNEKVNVACVEDIIG